MSSVDVTSHLQAINVVSQTQTITVNPSTGAVTVTNSGPVGPPGATGSPGPPGEGTGFDFVQAVDSNSWVINHNMGYKPSVQIFSAGGLEVIGEIHHVSNNQVTVSFNTPLSGSARLI